MLNLQSMGAPELNLDEDAVGFAAGETVWVLKDSKIITGIQELFEIDIKERLDAWQQHGVPYFRTTQFSAAAPYARIMFHNRAFYEQVTDEFVLAYKGTELHADDFSLRVEQMSSGRFGDSMVSKLDFFLNSEHKLPLGLGVAEAIEEAEAALALHQALIARFNEMTRLPIPLLVVKWSDESAEGYYQTVSRHMEPAAKRRLQELLQGGLASYIYAYQNMPVRARDVAKMRGGQDLQAYHEYLYSRSDPKETLDDWFALIARLLSVGYVPTSPAHERTGSLVQSQNAVIDGGFVDVGSASLASDFDQGTLNIALTMTLLDLAITVSEYSSGSPMDVSYQQMGITYTSSLLFVARSLAEKLKALPQTELVRHAIQLFEGQDIWSIMRSLDKKPLPMQGPSTI